MTHRITLEGASLRFAAAHFATFAGDCEPLHGHNYAVRVEISGDLSGDSWVLDFSEGRRIVGDICRELDHKFILQADSPLLAVAKTGEECQVTFAERRYVMPLSDVAELPIDNSTAERLAEWIAGRVAAQLAALGAGNVKSVTVGVEEAPGQAGWFTLAVTPSGNG